MSAKTSHTPEPWVTRENGWSGTRDIFSGDVEVCDGREARGGELSTANAERIVACVNACKGINPEAVPDLLKSLKRLCAWAEGVNEHSNEGGMLGDEYEAARAAIQKAEGA